MKYRTLEEQVEDLWMNVTPADYVIDFFDSIWFMIRFGWFVGVIFSISVLCYGLYAGWFESWYSHGIGDPLYFFASVLIPMIYFMFRFGRRRYI